MKRVKINMNFSKLKKQVLLKGGQILDPLAKTSIKNDMLIEDGKIKAIGKIKSSKSLEIIDCKNLILLTAFVMFMFILENLAGKIKKL